MPVFDFSKSEEAKNNAECTYTIFKSDEPVATAKKPMVVLDNSKRQWKHHSCGIFTNPVKRTTFEFEEEDGSVSADM